MSDPGIVMAMVEPLKAQLNVNLNNIRQTLEQLANAVEKASKAEDVSGELAAARGFISTISQV